jgi:RNA polymerase sigma-70 factor (ECF subfamily)
VVVPQLPIPICSCRVNVFPLSLLCNVEMAAQRPTVRVVEPAIGNRMRPEIDDLESLYRTAAPGLWRALYAFAGGRRQVAEDAVAEAYARAIEHAPKIRAPLPWNYRTAFRIALRELQREKRPPPRAPDHVPGIDPAEIQDLLRALLRLSPNQRAAVLLHDEEGFSAPEVARRLGMSAATVRVHLFRGRRRLRELLGDEENADD